MQLVGEHDGPGFLLRLSHRDKMVAFAVNPWSLSSLGVELFFRTDSNQIGHVRAKGVFDLDAGYGRILEQIVQQAGDDDILVEPGTIEDPGDPKDMLDVRDLAATANLAFVSGGGHPQGLFKA